MREEVTSVGIVLKAIPFKENDMILSVYFKEFGKLSLLASGLRKPKSKNASSCQPFMISEFTFFLKKGMCKLVSARLVSAHHHIESDLAKQACANLITEYFYRAIPENQPSLIHYDFLKQCLELLHLGYHHLQIYLFILAYILKDSGSAIVVDHCACCENTNEIVGISVSKGGFVCLKHLENNDDSYPVDFLKMFRLINKGNLSHIDKLTSDVYLLKGLKEIMERFYDEYCPIKLNSRAFI